MVAIKIKSNVLVLFNIGCLLCDFRLRISFSLLTIPLQVQFQPRRAQITKVLAPGPSLSLPKGDHSADLLLFVSSLPLLIDVWPSLAPAQGGRTPTYILLPSRLSHSSRLWCMTSYKVGSSERSSYWSVFIGSRFAIFGERKMRLPHDSRMGVQSAIKVVGIVRLFSLVKSRKVPTFPLAPRNLPCFIVGNRISLASINSGVQKKWTEM